MKFNIKKLLIILLFYGIIFLRFLINISDDFFIIDFKLIISLNEYDKFTNFSVEYSNLT